MLWFIMIMMMMMMMMMMVIIIIIIIVIIIIIIIIDIISYLCTSYPTASYEIRPNTARDQTKCDEPKPVFIKACLKRSNFVTGQL